jgi:hypothetical protein
MSIAVIGNDSIIHRRCEAEYLYALQDWFAWVEMNAWERVTAYYNLDRQKQIFLVVGQYLASSFAVAHKKYGSMECEIALESSIELPGVVEGQLSGTFGIKNVHAESGFDYVCDQSSDETGPKYSTILNVYSPCSGPLQRLKQTLKARGRAISVSQHIAKPLTA